MMRNVLYILMMLSFLGLEHSLAAGQCIDLLKSSKTSSDKGLFAVPFLGHGEKPLTWFKDLAQAKPDRDPFSLDGRFSKISSKAKRVDFLCENSLMNLIEVEGLKDFYEVDSNKAYLQRKDALEIDRLLKGKYENVYHEVDLLIEVFNNYRDLRNVGNYRPEQKGSMSSSFRNAVLRETAGAESRDLSDRASKVLRKIVEESQRVGMRPVEYGAILVKIVYRLERRDRLRPEEGVEAKQAKMMALDQAMKFYRFALENQMTLDQLSEKLDRFLEDRDHEGYFDINYDGVYDYFVETQP